MGTPKLHQGQLPVLPDTRIATDLQLETTDTPILIPNMAMSQDPEDTPQILITIGPDHALTIILIPIIVATPNTRKKNIINLIKALIIQVKGKGKGKGKDKANPNLRRKKIIREDTTQDQGIQTLNPVRKIPLLPM